MKKTILLPLFCVSMLLANGQEFKVKDIQLIPLSIFHSDKKQDTFSSGGLHFGIDMGFELFKQDLRLQLNSGTNVDILGSTDDSFYSVNLLYELSPNIASWMATDVYGGLGLFHASYIRSFSVPIDNTYFNIPVGLRFMFWPNSSLSFGLQFQADFNYDNTTTMYSTVLRYNFKH